MAPYVIERDPELRVPKPDGNGKSEAQDEIERNLRSRLGDALYDWMEIMSEKTQNENKWEAACKEFLTGCSCARPDHQEECTECLKAFCDHLRELAKVEDVETNIHCIKELKPNEISRRSE